MEDSLDIKSIKDDDLLKTYEAILDHLKYLNESIIVLEDENVSIEEDGGDQDE